MVPSQAALTLKKRLVLVFLLLAVAMAFPFLSGAQKAFSIGWRDGARPSVGKTGQDMS